MPRTGFPETEDESFEVGLVLEGTVAVELKLGESAVDRG
jgi:hypothetical protein